MHSIITHLQDKQDDSVGKRHVAKMVKQLKHLPGFLHLRLIPHYQKPTTCTVITFWASRRSAHANKKYLDEIFKIGTS